MPTKCGKCGAVLDSRGITNIIRTCSTCVQTEELKNISHQRSLEHQRMVEATQNSSSNSSSEESSSSCSGCVLLVILVIVGGIFALAKCSGNSDTSPKKENAQEIQSDSTSDPFREPQVINPIPQTRKGNLPELKGRLAAVNSKMTTDRKRFQSALGTINRLTNYKRTPVQEGTQAYQQCLNASKIIQEIEAGVPVLKAEKASLEAQISELEKQP